MARFRATIKGARGEASRLGTPKSGLSATINGWDAGVKVSAYTNSLGRDQFVIYVTGGSHGGISPTLALSVTDTPDGPKVERLG
jgi:hypothetical protein